MRSRKAKWDPDLGGTRRVVKGTETTLNEMRARQDAKSKRPIGKRYTRDLERSIAEKKKV